MSRNTIAAVSLVALLIGVFLRPAPAHAIIFLPAFLIIPIAQLVAWLLGGITLPAVLTGFIWSKLFKKSWKRGLVYSFVFLIILGLAAAVILKIVNPNRPLF